MLAEIFSETGLIVIAIVLVLIFGGAALPKLARSLGSAQTEFKKGLVEGAQASDAKDATKDATKGDASV